MSNFIDNPQEIIINDIGSDWVQMQIQDKTCVLSYDAAIDLAMRLAMVTSKMDQTAAEAEAICDNCKDLMKN